MVAKATSKKKAAPTLGSAVLIYSKGSNHYIALAEPTIISIEGLAFIEGRQVTGKVGHRMEGKRTLIPCDHVASIVEFPSEEDLFSEPQAKLVRPPEEQERMPLLTSHEQSGQAQGRGHPRPQGDHNHHRNRRHRNRNRGSGGAKPDAKFQAEYDAQRSDGFRRQR